MPTAAQVLDRYVQVTGGAAAYRSKFAERDEIECVGTDGKRVILQAEISTQRGGNRISEIHVPEEMSEGVFNGVAWAWSHLSGPRIKRGLERTEALLGAHLLEEADWRALYPKSRVEAIQEIAGRRCYRVVLVPDSGATKTNYYDVKTGYLVRREFTSISPKGTSGEQYSEEQYTVESYTAHGGILSPSRLHWVRDGSEYTLNIKRIIYNSVPGPAFFRYPPEVANYLASQRKGTALPNAEEVVERHIFESGGPAAYGNLKSQQIAGRLQFVDRHIDATMHTWAAEGGKLYQAIDIPGLGKQEEGSDGEVSWERSPILGPRVKPSRKTGLSVTMDAASVLAWRLVIDEVRTEAEEMVDGRRCYRVHVIPRDGSQIVLRWYDADTGLLYRTALRMKTDMGSLPTVLTFEEYRDVAGLKWPVRIHMLVTGQELLFTSNEVLLNEPIDGSVFELPEEVRRLADKKLAERKQAEMKRASPAGQ